MAYRRSNITGDFQVLCLVIERALSQAFSNSQRDTGSCVIIFSFRHITYSNGIRGAKPGRIVKSGYGNRCDGVPTLRRLHLACIKLVGKSRWAFLFPVELDFPKSVCRYLVWWKLGYYTDWWKGPRCIVSRELRQNTSAMSCMRQMSWHRACVSKSKQSGNILPWTDRSKLENKITTANMYKILIVRSACCTVQCV